MDVKGLLKELPGGDVAACTRVGLSNWEILRSRLVDINTGTLVGSYGLYKTGINEERSGAPILRGGIASNGEHGLALGGDPIQDHD